MGRTVAATSVTSCQPTVTLAPATAVDTSPSTMSSRSMSTSRSGGRVQDRVEFRSTQETVELSWRGGIVIEGVAEGGQVNYSGVEEGAEAGGEGAGAG